MNYLQMFENYDILNVLQFICHWISMTCLSIFMCFTAVFWKMGLSLSELHACLNNWHAWMINSDINLSMVFMGVQEPTVCRSRFWCWINHRSRTDREWAMGMLSSSNPVYPINVFRFLSLNRPQANFVFFLPYSQCSGICLNCWVNIVSKMNNIQPLWGLPLNLLWGVLMLLRWHSGTYMGMLV